jgi:hypothetical protein
MAEEDADYAHADDMPTDIPYYGYNGCGGDYGDGAFACDGKTFAEVETGHNGRFLVDWDIKKQRPYRCSLGQIHRYIKVRNKVDKLFARLKKSKPAKQKLTT